MICLQIQIVHGPTLGGRFPELVETVNRILDGGQPTPEPTPTPSFEPYTVEVTTDCLNIRQGAGTNYAIVGQITDRGIYTIVEESTGNGAYLWGKLKSGAGWIALDYTSKGGDIPEPTPPEGGDEPVKKYKNGSTKEKVYSDTDLTMYVGYLSPYEECDCFGIFNGRPMVRYHVDDTDNYKIGFCEWRRTEFNNLQKFKNMV